VNLFLTTSTAKDHLRDLVDRHDVQVCSFHGYGSDFMKNAGYSPDAYVQMAMQLASFRLWGEQAGTYEASQGKGCLLGMLNESSRLHQSE
jgi:carnitine O-acetyltransferase